ncbi:hypothetical protein CLV40_111179 [Actinokineospora auranticolor]|uniref:Resolvase-like protein n=2 Tax=Actinokineospora auranticolor TaxID=155976 RepID=A0A2S6GLW6_9PSEU|nr:hypothetical protein CLV40_111179 [Actinokineospora auranticolor]
MDGLTPEDLARRLASLGRDVTLPPRFRADSSHHTLVYGYIDATGRRPDFGRACRRVLEDFCRRERLRLCGVFVDRDLTPGQIQRPGFTGLCDVLRLPDSYAAVAVDAGHLFTDSSTAAALTNRLRGTGARLLLARGPSPSTASQPPTRGHPPDTPVVAMRRQRAHRTITDGP